MKIILKKFHLKIKEEKIKAQIYLAPYLIH